METVTCGNLVMIIITCHVANCIKMISKLLFSVQGHTGENKASDLQILTSVIDKLISV